MPHLIVRAHDRPPREVSLDDQALRIGRSAGCEVVVEDEGASRVHAVVKRSGAGFVIEDAGSRNGTFVNDERVERRALSAGDRIRVGRRTELEFVADESEPAPVGGAGWSRRERRDEQAPPAPARPGPRGGRSLLRVTRYELVPQPPARGAGWRLDARVTTVGREGAARLVLEDESVSRLHARLDREGGALFVTDLKSRNGTTVNGEPVLRAALEDGDVVSFGNVVFEVVRQESLAWKRLGLALGAALALVAAGFGVWALTDALTERSAVAEAQKRVRAQALASLSKGIAAFRRGDVDYARGYLLYAADVLLISNLAPPGASLSRPRELFGPIARELPAQDRTFDFSQALDIAAASSARAKLEGLSSRDYVDRQTRRIAIEMGQDENVPAGFVEQVGQFVDAYASHPASFQRILDRSSRMQGRLQAILEQAHLPEAFCYVAWIESGLDPHATSPVGARGLWQFMPSTARLYGLRVEGGVDERTDVARSTKAATGYIGNLIRKFGREQFMCALASYNRGENAVWRAMEKIPDPMMESSRKYWYLVENRLLPRETSEYVPKIFAARILAEDPERFGMRRP